MRATYNRHAVERETLYNVKSIPLSPLTILLKSTGVLFKAIFVLIAACLFFIIILGGLFGTIGAIFGFLCGIAATVLIGRRDFQTLAKMAGSRRPAKLQITETMVDIARGSLSSTQIQRETIRRLRLANTLNANFTPEPSYIVGVGAQGALFAATLTTRASRISRLARDCFSVMLGYKNESIVVADGLDEITAKNIFDDLAHDLKMR